MSANTLCTSCLRVLRHQIRRDLYSKPLPNPAPRTLIRPLSTTPSLHATPEPTSKPQAPPAPRFQKPSSPSADALQSFAATVRQTSKSTTEPYIAYGSTEDLYRSIQLQCAYTIPARRKNPPEPPPKNAVGEDVGVGEGWWYTAKEEGGLGLDVTFNTWAQVSFLYLYGLTVRLRAFPAENARVWHQQLLDHFFYKAEERMTIEHNITMRGTRNKYLKDLWQQWRGVLVSYDEGLIKGDAVLAGAIWRNVFKAKTDTDIGDLALVTAWMRSQLKALDELSDETLASGVVQWGDPAAVKGAVVKTSPWIQRAFKKEELEGKVGAA